MENNEVSVGNDSYLEPLQLRIDLLGDRRGRYFPDRFMPFRDFGIDSRSVDSELEQKEVASLMARYVEQVSEGTGNVGQELARIALAAAWLTGSHRNESIRFASQYDEDIRQDLLSRQNRSFKDSFDEMIQIVAEDIKDDQVNDSEIAMSPIVERLLAKNETIKDVVETLASRRRGVMDPHTAIGLLLLTEQVDADKLSPGEQERYKARAATDLRVRVQSLGYRDGASDRVISALIGSPRDDRPPVTYRQKLSDFEDLYQDPIEARRQLDSRIVYELELIYHNT